MFGILIVKIVLFISGNIWGLRRNYCGSEAAIAWERCVNRYSTIQVTFRPYRKREF